MRQQYRSKQQLHHLSDSGTVQYWSVIFKLWSTMFTKHQGRHPSKHLLFKVSFKACITKQNEQLKHVLGYVQMHTSLHSSPQQSHLTQNCLLLSPQPQLPEPSKGSGTTWSFASVIQHQAGCRRLDPACNPSCCCCCAGPRQKQRLWMSDLVWISAASC